MTKLLDVMDERDLGVICVTETKRKGNVMTDLSNSRDRRTREQDRLVSAVVEYKTINPRLLCVRVCASIICSIRRTRGVLGESQKRSG